MSSRGSATPPTPSDQQPAKVQPTARNRSSYPVMEPPSKTTLTYAEEKAIFDAMRPTIARQRAQSKERKEEKSRARQSYPAHPRMSQARQAAARALWEAPLTGTEWVSDRSIL